MALGETKCNFCGKTDEKVWLMIHGIDAYICSDCVFLCMEMIVDRTRGEEPICIEITEKGKKFLKNQLKKKCSKP